MFDSDDPDISPFTTARLVRACGAAQLRLVPLAGIVAPLARSRPDAAVPEDVLVLARQALRAVAPVAMSLGAPSPVPLHAPLTYAGLAARIALATQQAAAFRSRYRSYNERFGEVVWHVRGWLEEEATRRAVIDDLERAGYFERPHEPEVSPADA